MRALQRDEVVAAFSDDDLHRISLPAFDRIPWASLDFLGWCDRAGDKAFMVFDDEGEVSGLALARMAVRVSNARSFMCSICRTMHGMRGIASFTHHSRQGAGYNTLTDTFCGNLQCSLYVRGVMSPDIPQFYETISVERKIERLQTGVERFLASIAKFDSRRQRVRLRLVR
jgi:hypothetical protein